MANEQNIIPHRFTPDQSREEAAKNGRKGGVASGEAKRERKHGMELVRMLLAMDANDPDIVAKMKALGFDNIDNETVMHVRQIEKAQRTADTKAYSAVMKAAGYDQQNINVNGPLIVDKDELDALKKWSK